MGKNAEKRPHGPVSEYFMRHHYGPSGYVKPVIAPVDELILYTKHWPDCSGAPIACACGLSQLIARVKKERPLEATKC